MTNLFRREGCATTGSLGVIWGWLQPHNVVLRVGIAQIDKGGGGVAETTGMYMRGGFNIHGGGDPDGGATASGSMMDGGESCEMTEGIEMARFS